MASPEAMTDGAAVISETPTRRQLTMLWWFRVLVRPLREVWWWLFRLGRQIGRWPTRMLALGCVLAFVEALAEITGRRWLPLVVLAPFVVVGLWARWAPAHFERNFTRALWRSRTGKQVCRMWPDVMHGCGLTHPARPVMVKGPTGPQLVTGPPMAPVLASVTWDERQNMHLVPRLLIGQTVADVQAVSERLRTALGAHRLRVVPNAADTACELVGVFGDPLVVPFLVRAPDPVIAVPRCDWVEMGITENGDPFRLPVRVSTLTAGKSGSGKASAMHNLILGLAPAARAGLVELHGIDLKGGMELSMCQATFTRLATDVERAVILLEEAVAACERRAAGMAGVSRLHAPTTADPLVVVIIDELSSLVSYLPDRDLLRRSETALARLLAIGRAPGFVVHAFLQDPRKETVKARNLFNQFLALRLDSREEVAMTLGDGAVEAGARAHKINAAHPGIGYAKDETGQLVRIRLGHVTDATLIEVGRLFPAARQIPVELPGPDQADTRPARTRAPRTRRSTLALVEDNDASSDGAS